LASVQARADTRRCLIISHERRRLGFGRIRKL